MKWRKLLVLIGIFLLFLGVGTVCSNMQSQLADQILQSRGMSMESRIVKAKKSQKISAFIKWLEKEYPKESIQLQLKNKQDSNQILIWAQNRDLAYFPVSSGRFFSADDFTSRVTLAAISSATEASVIRTQGNSYLNLDDSYYSVVGTLKAVPYQNSKDYYLTTGEKQATANGNLKNYTIYVDASSATISKIASHLGSYSYWPDYVKRNRQRRLTLLMPEAILITFMLGFGILLVGLYAYLTFKGAEMSHVKGELLINLVLNKSGRFIVFLILESLGAYYFLIWKAYFGNRMALGLILTGTTVIELITYTALLVYFIRKMRMVNDGNPS